MRMRPDYRKSCFVVALIFATMVVGVVSASAGAGDTVDVDELYFRASEAARAGDRVEARRLAVEVLIRAPEYSDATVLLARMDGWDGRYEPARDALESVIARDPEHLDARKALIDVEYWSGEHARALELCDQLRPRVPEDVELESRCDQVARALGPARAGELASASRSTGAGSEPPAAAMPAYRASLDYENRSFDDDLDPWHRVSLSSERKDARIALIGRASFVERFGDQAVQLDAEAYPVLAKRAYAHLLASWASGDILADVRLWGEVYHALPYATEGSFGVRWSRYDDDIVSVTGSLAREWRQWWFVGRFLVDNRSGETAATGIWRARYRFDDPEDSITGTVAYGNSIDQDKGPDPGAPAGSPEVVRLFEIETTALELEWRKRILPQYVARLSFGTHFEDIEGRDRTQFLVGLGFQHLF
jgi:YaiO family outer membrane protein